MLFKCKVLILLQNFNILTNFKEIILPIRINIQTDMNNFDVVSNTGNFNLKHIEINLNISIGKIPLKSKLYIGS